MEEQGRRRRPRLPGPTHGVLTSGVSELLADLHRNGAMFRRRAENAAASVGADLEELVVGGLVRKVMSEFGELYVLGSLGKRLVGVSGRKPVSVSRALDQAVLREVVRGLEAEGWIRYGDLPGLGPLYRTPDGKAVCVAVRCRRPSARALRRVIRRHRAALIREGAELVLWTAEPWRLRKAAQKIRVPVRVLSVLEVLNRFYVQGATATCASGAMDFTRDARAGYGTPHS